MGHFDSLPARKAGGSRFVDKIHLRLYRGRSRGRCSIRTAFAGALSTLPLIGFVLVMCRNVLDVTLGVM